MRGPLDPVAEQRDRDHQQPFPARVFNMAPAQPHRRAGDHEREGKVQPAVIPARGFRNEAVAESRCV